jgi:hypothetical protein
MGSKLKSRGIPFALCKTEVLFFLAFVDFRKSITFVGFASWSCYKQLLTGTRMCNKDGIALAEKTEMEKNCPSDVPTTLLGLNGLETGPRHPEPWHAP